MSPIELNKIAASILLAGIIAMVAGIAADSLYHKPAAEKRGFSVEVAEETPAGTAAPIEEALDIAALMASADVAAGQETAKKCAACHDFTKGGPNKVGPNLWDIVNGPKAHKEDYSYSKALAELHSEKWTYENLFKFLKKPSAYIKGNKMSFAGLSKPEDLANTIAYLRSLSDSPQPLP